MLALNVNGTDHGVDAAPETPLLWALREQLELSGTHGQFSPNAWLRAGTDNAVTIIVDRSEMSQGVMTALPMILAEELEADWSLVRTEFAPADPVYANPLLDTVQQTGRKSSPCCPRGLSLHALWLMLRCSMDG